MSTLLVFLFLYLKSLAVVAAMLDVGSNQTKLSASRFLRVRKLAAHVRGRFFNYV